VSGASLGAAPAHLAAAHVIACKQPLVDVFELGAVEGNGKPLRIPGQPYPDEE
jgi:hypothetical protein